MKFEKWKIQIRFFSSVLLWKFQIQKHFLRERNLPPNCFSSVATPTRFLHFRWGFLHSPAWFYSKLRADRCFWSGRQSQKNFLGLDHLSLDRCFWSRRIISLDFQVRFSEFPTSNPYKCVNFCFLFKIRNRNLVLKLETVDYCFLFWR